MIVSSSHCSLASLESLAKSRLYGAEHDAGEHVGGRSKHSGHFHARLKRRQRRSPGKAREKRDEHT